MREKLEEANRAPMIETPRWIAWAVIALLVALGVGVVAGAVLRMHHH